MKDRRLKRSQAQERRVARRFGAMQHSGSGNGPNNKNDMRTERWWIEAKCRARPDAKQITVKLADLEDVRGNALQRDRFPMLTFELGGRDYYIVGDDVLAELGAFDDNGD